MRAEFLDGLAELAHNDPRVVLITADLGFGSIEVFAEQHPTRFFNLGVTEQAIVGVATGLAEGGYLPYCYSIASFSIARTFEFLRNGPIAHRFPVVVVGIGPGLDYSFDGLTHFALEDIGLVGGQPETTIIAPVDGASARRFAANGIDHAGLTYFRLARNVPPSQTEHFLARSIDTSCLVLGFGDSSAKSIEISSKLSTHGIAASVRMVDILNEGSLLAIVETLIKSQVRVLVTVENHYVSGGFGTMIADALMAQNWRGSLVKWGVEKLPVGPLGDSKFVIEKYCTPVSTILDRVLSSVEILR